ncbi:MAG: metal ABC transporter permease [Christensenellales bacterium]|jgi:zinc transport system permease protein|nr:metal ABC transporter permease [Clostridiales bacterium]
MTNAWQTLTYYFEFPFVRYALVVGIAVALCTSLLGVVLVLKRFSYIGDGLSHIAFGAIALATALKISNNMLLVVPITAAFAILLLMGGQRAQIKGDAAIAVLSVSSLAIGYLLLNAFPSSTNISGDVCTTLFGATSILTLTMQEVWMSLGLSTAVLLIFVFLYHRIFSVTFDEDFATATGTSARAYNLLLAVVIAVVVVLAMNLVGTLLITALLIFPALSAMRVFRSFRGVTICAAVLSVVCALLGIVLSILAGTPVGATIVIANLACFLLFSILGLVTTRRFA